MFYEHPRMADGHLGKCKDCTKADSAARLINKRQDVRAYEARRSQDPARKKKLAEYRKKRDAAHPDKYRARNAVNNALRDGKIVRQPCQCVDPKTQAHHARGYVNALDVDWLCLKHHREAHGQKAGPF